MVSDRAGVRASATASPPSGGGVGASTSSSSARSARHRRLGLLALLLLASPAVGASGQAADAVPFTAQQSAQGARVYAQHCAACHGQQLEGFSGPVLAGPAFYGREMGVPLHATFQYMAREMPVGRPGSLRREDYAALMALILEKNGYPAGDVALDYDTALHADAPLYFHRP